MEGLLCRRRDSRGSSRDKDSCFDAAGTQADRPQLLQLGGLGRVDPQLGRATIRCICPDVSHLSKVCSDIKGGLIEISYRTECSRGSGNKKGVGGSTGHLGLALLHGRLVRDKTVREQWQLVSHSRVQDVPAR